MHGFACLEGRRCFRGDLSCPQVHGFVYPESKSRCRSGVDGTSLIKPRLPRLRNLLCTGTRRKHPCTSTTVQVSVRTLMGRVCYNM